MIAFPACRGLSRAKLQLRKPRSPCALGFTADSSEFEGSGCATSFCAPRVEQGCSPLEQVVRRHAVSDFAVEVLRCPIWLKSGTEQPYPVSMKSIPAVEEFAPGGLPAHPVDESQRLQALRRLCLLDTPAEAAFDRLTRVAQHALKVPIALVSLVDAERQWFKSRQGLTATETPREIAFCAHAILNDRLFVVPDAAKDPRFAANPLVVGELGIRFYAGRPLHGPSGHLIGTLCVIDRVPRALTPEDQVVLGDLACLVEEQIAANAASWRLVRTDEERRRFRTLAECSPVGVFETDEEGACTYTNRRWQEITGLSAEAALGQGWVDAIDPDDRLRVFEAWNSAALSKANFEQTFRFRRPSGEVRWVQVQAAPVRDVDGQILSWVGVDNDVTEVRAMQEALSQSEARFRQLAAATGEVFWIVDTQTSALLYISPAYERVWKRSLEEAMRTPHHWLGGVHCDDQVRARAALENSARTGEPFELEFRIVLPDGSIRHTLNRGFPVVDAGGVVVRIAGVAADVTSLHEAREELRRLASQDVLTGLPNSRTFHELLVHELHRSRRSNSPLSVAFVDIDHFKSVNDNLGHAAGDIAIKAVADRIRRSLRNSDVLARVGGDEFCVIMPDCNEEHAEKALGQVVRNISQHVIAVDSERSLSITLSVGVASTRGGALTEAALLEQADVALYNAKHRGRNQVCSGGTCASMIPDSGQVEVRKRRSAGRVSKVSA